MTEPDTEPLRALFDANVHLSYLLSNNPDSAGGIVLRVGLARRFRLLYAEAVRSELYRKLAQRRDLRARIPRVEADDLFTSIADVAEPIPPPPPPYAWVGSDRKDDDLFAHAIAGRADYFVTWDKQLRALSQVEGVKIVSPPEFLEVLRERGLV